jgi:phosphoesterase RecJ-like protein
MNTENTHSSSIKNIENLCKIHNNIVIISHFNPDGDAVGSSLGMYHFLKQFKQNVSVIMPNDFPEFLHWMPSVDDIIFFNCNTKIALEKINSAEILFFLDFNDLDRIPELKPHIEKSKAIKVLIDHHPYPTNFCDISISDINFSSTAEMVCYYIVESKQENLINKKVAECLFAGILTDTISFTVNAFRPRTFNYVAKLLEKGINRDDIHDKIFNNFSADRMKFLGYTLNKKMVVLPDFKTAYIHLNKAEQKEFSFAKGDTEGFVNYPLSIKGVIFSAFFIEKKDMIKISFRSKGDNKINEIASKYFNGGGHKNAAGGEMSVSLENAVQTFIDVLPELLKSNNIDV